MTNPQPAAPQKIREPRCPRCEKGKKAITCTRTDRCGEQRIRRYRCNSCLDDDGKLLTFPVIVT